MPGGYAEGRVDALKKLMANVYSFITSELDPERDADRIDFPTFQDGYRANCVVDAIVRSNVDRSRRTKVEYGRNDE